MVSKPASAIILAIAIGGISNAHDGNSLTRYNDKYLESNRCCICSFHETYYPYTDYTRPTRPTRIIRFPIRKTQRLRRRPYMRMRRRR